MSNLNYLPIPAKVWSRVQSSITIENDITNETNTVYVPLTKKTVSLAVADYEKQMLYKGNVLQYKGNNASFTKNQYYSKLCKGMGPNRTKTFATQTTTYSNPNTKNLLRVNYTSVAFPNEMIGQPNNISGPFQYNVPNPFGCSNNTVTDGGNLIGGTYANPCTNQIIKNASPQQNCYPTYCSDVPGKIQPLCWNPKSSTWFSKKRNINNSANKWPQGYKSFVSANKNTPPTLVIENTTNTTITLSWTSVSNNCLPISSYNIYQNGILLISVPYTETTYIINILSNTTYSFYITAVSNTVESEPSNTVTYN